MIDDLPLIPTPVIAESSDACFPVVVLGDRAEAVTDALALVCICA